MIKYQKENGFIQLQGRVYASYKDGIKVQISNMFTATNEYQSAKSRFATEFKNGESSYLIISEFATANHQWKCEKCEKLVVNLKELKLHKFDTVL